MKKIIKWLEDKFARPDNSTARDTFAKAETFIGKKVGVEVEKYEADSSCEVTVPDLKIIDGSDPEEAAGFNPYDTVVMHKDRSYDKKE